MQLSFISWMRSCQGNQLGKMTHQESLRNGRWRGLGFLPFSSKWCTARAAVQMILSDKNWKESFISPSFPLSPALLVSSVWQFFAVLLFCRARFELLSLAPAAALPSSLWSKLSRARSLIDYVSQHIFIFLINQLFQMEDEKQSLLFFLEGRSDNTDSARWLSPWKARQSKCSHKRPECQM